MSSTLKEKWYCTKPQLPDFFSNLELLSKCYEYSYILLWNEYRNKRIEIKMLRSIDINIWLHEVNKFAEHDLLSMFSFFIYFVLL